MRRARDRTASAEWHPALSTFAETVAADVESDSVGGVTVALARDGEVLWSEAFGWADPEAGIPAARETIYRTGSISKSFTAVLMAIHIDDGVVSLDQPLESLVPEIAELQERLRGRIPYCARSRATPPDSAGAGAPGCRDRSHRDMDGAHSVFSNPDMSMNAADGKGE